MSALRVVAVNVGGLRAGVEAVAAVVNPLRPDVLIVRDGPWRLRWRTPTADLARACGLFYGGGGKQSAGNAVLVSLRLTVDDVRTVRFPLVKGRTMRGAVLLRCRLGERTVTLGGAGFAPERLERAGQVTEVARLLDEVAGPLVFACDADPSIDAGGWDRLTAGRRSAGEPTAGAGTILVTPDLDVTRWTGGPGPVLAEIALGAPRPVDAPAEPAG
jgi:hypothetical protein